MSYNNSTFSKNGFGFLMNVKNPNGSCYICVTMNVLIIGFIKFNISKEKKFMKLNFIIPFLAQYVLELFSS